MNIIVSMGLIIADPWLDQILDGTKTWEMRSAPTSFRGQFALIRKGAAEIPGIAMLAGVGWALPPRQMLETRPLHRIPVEMLQSGEFDTLNVPWILTRPKRLDRPITYQPSGDAVDWVHLPEDVTRSIAIQLADNASADPGETTVH